MFQGFEWYSYPTATASHWKRLTTALPHLQAIGIDTIWLPPGCKASSPKGNGYDIYDLYDLGEFNQKGSRATKWGTKEELVELCQTAKGLGVGVIWDAVLNHKAAADGRETCQAVKVNEKGEPTSPCLFSTPQSPTKSSLQTEEKRSPTPKKSKPGPPSPSPAAPTNTARCTTPTRTSPA